MKAGLFDPAVAQWALRDGLAQATLGLIIGAVGLGILVLLAAVSGPAARVALCCIVAGVAVCELILTAAAWRLHRRIQQLEDHVP